jgi:hypothetical protein
MNSQYTEYTEAPSIPPEMQAPFDKVISSSMVVFAIFIFLFIGGLIVFSWWINVKVLSAPLFELLDYSVNKESRKPPAKDNALARS